MSYWLSIVSLNVCLSCTVTEIFTVEYLRVLEIWVRSRAKSLEMGSFGDALRVPIRVQ